MHWCRAAQRQGLVLWLVLRPLLRLVLARLPLLAPLLLLACAADRHVAPLAGDGTAPIAITEQLLDSDQLTAARPPDWAVLAATPASSAYKIGPGDLLSITVWDHPELSAVTPREQSAVGMASAVSVTPPPAGFVVDQAGVVQFPYAGALTLAGLSEPQARALLTARLAHYIRNPDVTLRVLAYRSQRVYVDGEVKAPGLQPINDIPMTLLEALDRAGGLLPTADQSRIALERGGNTYRIDLIRWMRSGSSPSSLMLADGDIVRVPPRDESKVFVSGEVLAPRALTMHDGRMSLNEALGEAGGINPQSGDAGQVYVVRHTEQGARVYWLDARAASALALAERFELHAKDVVYVAASPLANWHRTISLLIPGELSSAVGATK